MDKTDPLAQLKDIHLPAPISWWPLAPGWYVVIALALILTLLLTYQMYKKHRYALAKKQALSLLALYQEQYEKKPHAPETSAHISELLRRVALVYYPRKEVASLHGEAWLHFLNQTGKDIDFSSVRTMLLDAPFQADNNINLKPLFIKAQQWIKQRGVPCSN